MSADCLRRRYAKFSTRNQPKDGWSRCWNFAQVSLTREGEEPTSRRPLRQKHLPTISAATAVVRLHLAEELECVAGLDLGGDVGGDLALEPPPCCRQVLVFHQVVQPAAA